MSLAVEYEFGCQYHNTNLFTTQISNGILGFSRSAKTLIHAMMAQGKLAEHVFGMCFSYAGGEMVLGAPAGDLLEQIKWAALVASSSSWYRVEVKALTVASSAVGSWPLASSTASSMNS